MEGLGVKLKRDAKIFGVWRSLHANLRGVPILKTCRLVRLSRRDDVYKNVTMSEALAASLLVV